MAKAQSFAGFEELEAIIDEGLAAKRAKEAMQKAKDRLIVGAAGKEQLAEDAARLRAWDAAHCYTPVALCAFFIEQECAECGEFQYFNQGLFAREEHRTQRGTRRWLPLRRDDVEKPSTLPREVMKRHVVVPFCGECLTSRGFQWERSYYEGEDPIAELAEVDAALAKLPLIVGATAAIEVYPGVAMTPWPFESLAVA